MYRYLCRPVLAAFAVGITTFVTVGTASTSVGAIQTTAAVAYIAGDVKLSSGDATLVKHLSSVGASVALIDDDDVRRTDFSTSDVVFVSSSVRPSTIGKQFSDITTPIIVAEHQLLDDMGMTTSKIRSHKTNAIAVTQPKHPLAAGLNGRVSLSTRVTMLGSATPGPDADIVATVANRPALFMYETGDSLANGKPAPAARIAIPLGSNTAGFGTSALFDLVDVAVTLGAASNAAPHAEDDVYVTNEDRPITIGTGLSPMHLLVGYGTDPYMDYFDWVGGITFDSYGDIVATDRFNNYVKTCHISGSWCTTIDESDPGADGFGQLDDVEIDAAGNYVMSDSTNDLIRICHRNGLSCTEFGGTGEQVGEFDRPRGVDIDGLGNIVIADSNNSRIQTCDPTTGQCTAFGSPGSQRGEFYSPEDVAVLPDGDLLISESENNRIQRCSPNGSTCSLFPTPGATLVGPRLITATPAGDVLIANSQGEGFIWCPATTLQCQQYSEGLDGDEDNSLLGQFHSPYGIAQSPTGMIAVTDPGTVGIHFFSPGGLLYNDRDPDGDDLSVIAVGPGQNSVGAAVETVLGATVTVQSDGSFVYDPTTSSTLQALPSLTHVDDSFTYRISDGRGGEDTATAYIAVAGRAEYDFEPEIVTEQSYDDVIRMYDVNQVIIDLDAVDDNDAERDGLTWDVWSGEDRDWFTVDVNGGVRFEPPSPYLSDVDADADGIYVIGVRVTDSSGGSDYIWLRIDGPTTSPMF